MQVHIPEYFFNTNYDGEKYPGNATGLGAGANCQHFSYEVLRHFGFEIGNMRSSDLWIDRQFTEASNELNLFDLVLFNSESEAYGAHVGICVGKDKILHLSKEVGHPVVWDLSQFQKRKNYSHFLGIKRPKLQIPEDITRKFVTCALFILLALFPFENSFAKQFDCLDLPSKPVLPSTRATNTTDDFATRDSLPETEVPEKDWRTGYGRFGPCPLTFPVVINTSPLQPHAWNRKRVIEAAKKYIGLPYQRRHIPAMGGLDCSNFTAWIYNYAFGIRFSSNIKRQSTTAGRRLKTGEALKPGDLVFVYGDSGDEVVHVAVYVDSRTVIDAAESSIEIRPYSGRYKTNFAWARRVLAN